MAGAKKLDDCVLLQVEDDDATAFLFQKALREAGLSPQYFRVTDGEQATAFLLQDGRYQNAPRPNLVLLDLNLPRKGGLDVLAEMKDHLDLRDIPVVVFSASKLPYDRERAMQLGAVEFLHKPERDFDEFVRVAEAVCKRLTAEQ